ATGECEQIREQLAYAVIDNCPYDRPLKCPDTPNDHNEDHRHDPIQIERRCDGHEQCRHKAYTSGPAAPPGRSHIGDEAVAPDVYAEAGRGDFVVPHAEHTEPKGRVEQQVDTDHDSGGKSGRNPEVCQEKDFVVNCPGRLERHAADVAEVGRDEHQHGHDFGKNPGTY